MTRAIEIFIPVLFAIAVASNGYTADDKSVAFLLSSQNRDGGWGTSKNSKSTVADTAMAMMALLRSGENFKSSTNAIKMREALEYLILRIDKSSDVMLDVPDASSLIAQKLGPNKDLFFATWALAEAVGMPISKQNKNQALQAIKKSLAKIGNNLNALAKHQKGKSQYFGGLLGTAVQLKAISKAISVGVLPNKKMKEFLNNIDLNSINSSSGYALYDAASKLSIRYDLEMIKSMLDGSQQIFSPSKDFEAALVAFSANLTKTNFISGFGSLGGEEMLSYQLISEAVRFGGINQTDKWQQQFADVIDRAKNPDGSIVGKHCITGTTFPTAGSLLTKNTVKKPGITAKPSSGPKWRNDR